MELHRVGFFKELFNLTLMKILECSGIFIIPIGFMDVRKAVRTNSTYVECPPEAPLFFLLFFKLANLPFDHLVKYTDFIDFTIPEIDPWTQLEDKLMEHPQIHETIYGMKCLVCCFKEDAGEYKDLNSFVSDCLANDPRERDLDLILWPARNYSIYNCGIDLRVLHDDYGGYYIKRGRQSGRGMFLNSQIIQKTNKDVILISISIRYIS